MAGLKADRELRVRTLSSIVIASVIIAAISYGGYAWAFTSSAIALISLSEYYALIAHRKGYHVSPGIGYIFSLLCLFSAMQENAQPIILALLIALCVCAVLVVEVFRRQLTRGESYAITNAGGVISGVVYITLPWCCMIMLREYIVGRQMLLTIFACTWGCDVFAYLGGRAFGSVKLCEHVSPGKTVQGFVAGVIGSLIVNACAIYYFKLPTYPLILIGFICGLAGQAGDLAESLIKRESGEKDSGTLIPGHGGMLDRFDSVLFNGLLTYFVLRVLL